MKYVVTGADGFIGSFLVEYLIKEGHFVYAIGIDESKLKRFKKTDSFCFIKCLFEDYHVLETLLPSDEIDCFFHLAWNGIFGEPFKDYSLQLDNCKYACDALMIAKTIGCRKFVLASTINVLEARHYMTIDDIKPRYANIYAMSKLSAEMICKTLAYQNGIEFNCGLIPTIYGEGNKADTVINTLLQNLVTNKETQLIPYTDLFDIVYVRDVAAAFFSIGEKGINQKTYYIGHSKPKMFGEIVDEIVSIVNPNGIVRFGVYPVVNGINFDIIDMGMLEKDTGFKCSYDFVTSILNTVKAMK